MHDFEDAFVRPRVVFAQLFQISPANVVEERLHSLGHVHPFTVERAVAAQPAVTQEYRLGGEIDQVAETNVERDGEGGLKGEAVVNFDVTERSAQPVAVKLRPAAFRFGNNGGVGGSQCGVRFKSSDLPVRALANSPLTLGGAVDNQPHLGCIFGDLFFGDGFGVGGNVFEILGEGNGTLLRPVGDQESAFSHSLGQMKGNSPGRAPCADDQYIGTIQRLYERFLLPRLGWDDAVQKTFPVRVVTHQFSILGANDGIYRPDLAGLFVEIV